MSRILSDGKSKNPDYHYVFIGDVIHYKSYFTRTKKSCPINLLKKVKTLVEEGKATLIRGNNEQYILDNINTPLKLIKHNQVRHTIECLRKLSMKESDGIIDWLQRTPTSLEVGKYRIAHAYYPHEQGGKTVTHWNIISGLGYPWFKRDDLGDHIDPEFTYVLGHYGYPFIKANLKIIDATLFEGVGVYYTDRDEFMVYF